MPRGRQDGGPGSRAARSSSPRQARQAERPDGRGRDGGPAPNLDVPDAVEAPYPGCYGVNDEGQEVEMIQLPPLNRGSPWRDVKNKTWAVAPRLAYAPEVWTAYRQSVLAPTPTVERGRARSSRPRTPTARTASPGGSTASRIPTEGSSWQVVPTEESQGTFAVEDTSSLSSTSRAPVQDNDAHKSGALLPLLAPASSPEARMHSRSVLAGPTSNTEFFQVHENTPQGSVQDIQQQWYEDSQVSFLGGRSILAGHRDMESSSSNRGTSVADRVLAIENKDNDVARKIPLKADSSLPPALPSPLRAPIPHPQHQNGQTKGPMNPLTIKWM